jgi:hypothetical protein
MTSHTDTIPTPHAPNSATHASNSAAGSNAATERSP